MKRAPTLLTAAAAMLLSVATGPAAMSPGLWEVQGTMGKRSNKSQRCVTAAELLADPLAAMSSKKNTNRCTFSNVVMQSGQLSYTASCRGPMGIRIAVQTRGTYTASSFNTTSDISAMGRRMAISSTGRLLSACTG